ncbi:MarR family winged helix-turn-helix transcriptional regulator [Desulfoferrobacter suflitae]|uniref:MarR family winged helix-turn-helix transcriptional regulator n=1 Tax=Desulfoferrobacter suflitae TaxID=2865782 RepID=UPI0021645B61|nr:MarR family transcriptional regulator [Desulfoferrobacter suflitae]MCK8603390.1 MarR family transcriptional regulator [Desulfoferrobacter suflitae]
MIDPVVLQIAKRLRQIMHEVDRYSKYLQENYQITIPQLVCLREIHDNGPISLGALSKIVYVNSSTVTGIVDRLEKRGLVRRTRVSKDRRQIHAEITDKGQKFIAVAPAPLEERFADRLKKLEKDEIKALLFAVEKLVAMLTPSDDGKASDDPVKINVGRG